MILVTELTRWGRSMLDLFHTLQDLQAWNVSLIAQTGLQLDLRSAQGKLIASLMAALAEFERDLLRERVRSGIAAAGNAAWCSAGGSVSGSKRIAIRRKSCSWSALVSRTGKSATGSGISKNTVLDIVKRHRAANRRAA